MDAKAFIFLFALLSLSACETLQEMGDSMSDSARSAGGTHSKRRPSPSLHSSTARASSVPSNEAMAPAAKKRNSISGTLDKQEEPSATRKSNYSGAQITGFFDQDNYCKTGAMIIPDPDSPGFPSQPSRFIKCRGSLRAGAWLKETVTKSGWDGNTCNYARPSRSTRGASLPLGVYEIGRGGSNQKSGWGLPGYYVSDPGKGGGVVGGRDGLRLHSRTKVWGEGVLISEHSTAGCPFVDKECLLAINKFVARYRASVGKYPKLVMSHSPSSASPSGFNRL